MEREHSARAVHSRALEFGPFQIDPDERLLVRDGNPLALTPKAFDVLLMLVTNAGRLLPKEEILRRVWPDTFVDEGNLTVQISTLRKLLGDEEGRYIETVPRHGYRFTAPVIEKSETSKSGAPVSPPARRSFVLILIAAAIAISAALLAMRSRRIAALPTSAQPIIAIAVLPLIDLSKTDDDTYFADGMTEELITHLAQIRALRVISPVSAARYRGSLKSLRQIGDELDVGGIVTGSLIRVQERVRINVRLVDSETEQTLWAEQYDRPMQDVLELQNEVARSIAGQIAITLTPGEERRLAASRKVHPAAHDAYLRGRFHFAQQTPDGFRRALALFHEAIDLDPSYASAHAGVAECYTTMEFFGMLVSEDAHPRARESAVTALRIDPELAEAHAALACVLSRYDWDWARSDAEFKRAIDLNPNLEGARVPFAVHLAAQGRFDESIAQARRSLQSNPFSRLSNIDLGWMLYFARRYDESIAQYKKALELAPNEIQSLEFLADTYAAAGNDALAVATYDAWAAAAGISTGQREVLQRAFKQGGIRAYWRERVRMEEQESSESGDYWPYRLAMLSARAGDRDTTIKWLETALAERKSRLIMINVDPLFDPVRDDPRFAELVRKVGIPSKSVQKRT
jgi:TolB-like protein/DNA-binding winged helix-turn-helix (wHTH) protein/Tfp pilus assembly protein PilF